MWSREGLAKIEVTEENITSIFRVENLRAKKSSVIVTLTRLLIPKTTFFSHGRENLEFYNIAFFKILCFHGGRNEEYCRFGYDDGAWLFVGTDLSEIHIASIFRKRRLCVLVRSEVVLHDGRGNLYLMSPSFVEYVTDE
jgi:hypothetical protein